MNPLISTILELGALQKIDGYRDGSIALTYLLPDGHEVALWIRREAFGEPPSASFLISGNGPEPLNLFSDEQESVLAILKRELSRLVRPEEIATLRQLFRPGNTTPATTPIPNAEDAWAILRKIETIEALRKDYGQ